TRRTKMRCTLRRSATTSKSILATNRMNRLKRTAITNIIRTKSTTRGLLKMALFYFLVKHAPGFPIPALRRNRSANSRGNPPGLAAGILVPVFSGHFAVAAGIAEAGGDALTVEEIAAATVAEIVAATAEIVAPT